MKKFLVSILCLLIVPVFTMAQFDDEKEEFGSDFKEESAKDDLAKDLKEEKSQSSDEFSEFGNESNVDTSISSADLKKFSEARKSRSEAAVVRAASEILSKDPKNVIALNGLAVFYIDLKKYGLAKILLKRALKDHPSEPALYNNLGVVYLGENDIPLALESFKKSVQARSGYDKGSLNLSSIYLEFRDYERSLSPLEDAYKAVRSDLRRGGENVIETANNYAVALMGVGENDKAAKVFEEIVDSNTRNPTPYLNYAILLVEVQNKKRDAIRIISKIKFISEDREILRRAEALEKKIE
jgi:tetratricopeptide (TPR) repeat protein